MKPAVKRFLGNYDDDVQSVNRLIVTSYLTCRDIAVDADSMLFPYLISRKDSAWEKVETFCRVLKASYTTIDLELLIDLFEFVVSPSDKVVTGAIYTPQYLRCLIIEHILHLLEPRDVTDLKIADIACGCGGFFLTICNKIQEVADVDCHYIFEHVLYGCDIEEYCIERCKILLTIKALERGERTDDLVFNLYQGNSLSFDWQLAVPGFEGFDAIVGNPPYVTSAKMSEETKVLLENWEVCSTGKADLYIPFFQIATELLNERGVVGYITVSNFYRSLNGKALRNYFANHELNLTIVDFGGEQVFKGCSTYTCLCFIDKQQEGMVRYVRNISSNIENVGALHYVTADYDDLDSAKGWVIKDRRIDGLLRQIENTGRPLGDKAAISNGIATLRNELYVLNILEETEDTFIHEYEGVHYTIEKEICRQVVKPSAMDVNKSVEEQIEWIIFPYEVRGEQVYCYDEKQMERLFPNALAYLTAVRFILNERDKGNREYEKWYAYGRSQAINMPGNRLLMPYIANRPTFFLTDMDGLLYYNGFALISDDILTLERLQKILNTDIFWFYVMNISKPYANGYYSMGKRYIRYFGVPDLSDEQLQQLDGITDKHEIENMLYPCYFEEDMAEVRKFISDYLKS